MNPLIRMVAGTLATLLALPSDDTSVFRRAEEKARELANNPIFDALGRVGEDATGFAEYLSF